MKKKIFGLCLVLLLTSGCGSVPQLSNGEDAVVSFSNGEMISVDDFYEQIKDSYGLEILVTMIDTYILETEFPDYVETAKEYAEATVDAYIENYGSESDFLSVLSYYGYSTIDAYENYLYLSYMQSYAIEEYSKDQITDDDIEDYYENRAVGDVEISHILITVDDDDDTDEAEEEAQAKVQEIIDALDEAKKNGDDIEETFAALAEEYSDDSSTSSNGGALGQINYGDLDEAYDELIDAALKLDVGEYSTSIITTELGYHVILKTAEYEKDSLEDLKDEIIDILAEEYAEANSDSISLTALQHYRKEYGMEIEDSELQTQYSNYISNALASIATSTD